MSEERVRQAMDHVEALEDGRKSWDGHLQDIADFVLPKKGRWAGRDSSPNDGSKRHRKVYDGTATRALRILAAGMMGGMTSPSRPWFRLGTPDPNFQEIGDVRGWLEQVERRLYWALSRSNFYQMAAGAYAEIGGFGSFCALVQESTETVVHFHPHTFGEYAWSINDYGRVDTVARRIWLPVKAVARQWGEEKLSGGAKKALEKTPFEYVQVAQLVRPREFGGGAKEGGIGKKDLPWESLVFEVDSKEGFLDDGGYEEFPFLCPRWSVTGYDTYGWSPSMDCLGDIKMLQELRKELLAGVQLHVGPPMRVPTNFRGRLNLKPRGQNFVSRNNQDGLAPLYQVNPDIRGVLETIEDTRKAIREGLFNDMFLLMVDRPDMTATEVMERTNEKMIMLGPVIDRLQHEMLDPLIERVYLIMDRTGLIPPAPREMDGMPLKVEYVSMLAQAQKQVGSQSITNLVAVAGQVAQLKPEALDKVDLDQAIDEFAIVTGAPAKLLVSDEDVGKIREQRQEEMAKQQAMQQALAAVPAAKDLSETSTEGKNALTDMMDDMQQEAPPQ